MKTSTLVLLAAVVLAGCAGQTKPMTTPSGKAGFQVSCNGGVSDWTDCYAAATKACNGKYNVVDRDGSTTMTGYGPMIRRSLIIECP